MKNLILSALILAFASTAAFANSLHCGDGRFAVFIEGNAYSSKEYAGSWGIARREFGRATWTNDGSVKVSVNEVQYGGDSERQPVAQPYELLLKVSPSHDLVEVDGKREIDCR